MRGRLNAVQFVQWRVFGEPPNGRQTSLFFFFPFFQDEMCMCVCVIERERQREGVDVTASVEKVSLIFRKVRWQFDRGWEDMEESPLMLTVDKRLLPHTNGSLSSPFSPLPPALLSLLNVWAVLGLGDMLKNFSRPLSTEQPAIADIIALKCIYVCVCAHPLIHDGVLCCVP